MNERGSFSDTVNDFESLKGDSRPSRYHPLTMLADYPEMRNERIERPGIHSRAWTVSPPGGLCEAHELRIKQWLQDKGARFAYVIEHGEKGGLRHMHAGILTKNYNLARDFRNWAIAELHYPADKKLREKWLDNRTWYKPGRMAPDGKLYFDDDGPNTWEDYQTKKDGWVYNDLPDDYEDALADHIPPDQRRASIKMQHCHDLEELFEKHNLPFKTKNDVGAGVSILAFELRVLAIPDRNKLKGYVEYAWAYMNKIKTSLVTFDEEKKVAPKRKRGMTVAEEMLEMCTN